MPTYSYACRSCGHEFDIQQSFSDDALTECPECGGQLRKRYGSVGVVFKGSGFYRTDNKSSTSGKRGGDAAKASGDSDSKGGAESSSPSGADASGSSGAAGATGAETKAASTSTSTPSGGAGSTSTASSTSPKS